MSSNNIFLDLITQQHNLSRQAVSSVVTLLNDGSTVPFIARYRKEMTRSMDEVDIENVRNSLSDLNDLVKRKETILKAIKEQDALTPALSKKIENCWDKTQLEDIYLAYKKKLKTKATVARQNGLEPLARIITEQRDRDLFFKAKKFINKKVPGVEAALEGARHIIAEWVSESAKVREIIRKTFQQSAEIKSKLVKSKKAEAQKYENYFEFNEGLKRCPSHRLLAMFRGEKEGFLRIKLGIDTGVVQSKIERIYINDRDTDPADQIVIAIEDSLKRLIVPSIENETRKEAKLKADKEAIHVFANNLRELLLAAPLGTKNTLALDPGYKSGCKLVILDNNGELIHNSNIYPHPPQNKLRESGLTIEHLCREYQVEAIAIGNGTAGKETYKFIKDLALSGIEIYFVNESGASIYSASLIAREEFPDHDITVRGAVSIGRRLMDPLAELVKIDPKSIGVGQYQHDVNQTLLKDSLETVISSCVNNVGVNVNTASKQLLTHVSGLGPVLAQNIIDYRSDNGSFRNRKEILDVKRMGKKSYEQCAGFLRIKTPANPLDNTGVHPESYSIVKKIAKDFKLSISELSGSPELKSIDLNKYVTDKVGLPTLKDIIKELEKPGLDPRGSARPVNFSDQINTISDVKTGMILTGVINNVTKFGAFVDIGIKESGLVHISQITNRFIKDPAEVVSVNQEVKVKVLDVDINKKRVSLSMKEV